MHALRKITSRETIWSCTDWWNLKNIPHTKHFHAPPCGVFLLNEGKVIHIINKTICWHITSQQRRDITILYDILWQVESNKVKLFTRATFSQCRAVLFYFVIVCTIRWTFMYPCGEMQCHDTVAFSPQKLLSLQCIF